MANSFQWLWSLESEEKGDTFYILPTDFQFSDRVYFLFVF